MGPIDQKRLFRSDVIKLIYWDYPNFGDALSPFIVGNLSGKKIVSKQFYKGRKRSFKRLIKCVKSGQWHKIRHIAFPWERCLVAVGSIMPQGTKRSVLWGCGFMNEDESFRGGCLCAVRGKYSKAKLEQQGFACPAVFGDPALLLPLMVPCSRQCHGVGIVPHWKETEVFTTVYGERYKVISLIRTDIDEVVSEITSCRRILSTSLHGIIVAHAYGIPALWIKKGYVDTDGFKFRDYFSSVDIPIYDGFTDIDDILTDEKTIESFFIRHADLALPHRPVREIQQALLRTAPFELLSAYRQVAE